MADTTKTTVTNTAEGPRGFWEGSACIMLDKDQSATADLTEDEVKAAKATGYFKVGTAKKDEKPALTGKNKAELIEIAKAEGVTVEDGASNDDIKSAIELHREG